MRACERAYVRACVRVCMCLQVFGLMHDTHTRTQRGRVFSKNRAPSNIEARRAKCAACCWLCGLCTHTQRTSTHRPGCPERPGPVSECLPKSAGSNMQPTHTNTMRLWVVDAQTDTVICLLGQSRTTGHHWPSCQDPGCRIPTPCCRATYTHCVSLIVRACVRVCVSKTLLCTQVSV